jgi:uncharacterized protein (TIGR02246 family)
MKTIFVLCLMMSGSVAALFSQEKVMTEKDQEAAVVGVAQKFIDAWNVHDMNAFATLFSTDSDFVNVIGQRWIGRDAIREAHAANHATIFKTSQLSMQDVSVRFLKPDVAVLRCTTKLAGQVDRSGNVVPTRYTLLTFVLVRAGGNWSIDVTQNTDINTAVVPIKPSL